MGVRPLGLVPIQETQFCAYMIARLDEAWQASFCTELGAWSFISCLIREFALGYWYFTGHLVCGNGLFMNADKGLCVKENVRRPSLSLA